jgi:hypothetical protein
MSPLGIIAGSGMLPVSLAQKCLAQGQPVAVVALEGSAVVADFAPHIRTALPLGRGRAMIRFFREHGVQEIVMIGAVKRPSFWDVRPDLWTLWHMGATLLRGNLGDDGLLRAIRRIFERQGFRLRGIQNFLPDLVATPGPLGHYTPDEAALYDIRRGLSVTRLIGLADVGQAAVVQGGIVLGVEAAEGTSALVRRCVDLKRGGPGPILIKAAKPDQDPDLDLPTIGPETIKAVVAGGYRGIAVQAGKTLLVDPLTMADLADQSGVFVVGIE